MWPRVYAVRKRDLRLAASLTLIAASAVVLVWGFWPQGQTVKVLRLNTPGVLPVRALRLEYPEHIRQNDRARVRLVYEVDPEVGAPPTSPDIPESSTVESVDPIAEARLEVPGALVRPPDSIHEALAEGRPLEFYWTVVLNTQGEYRGTAWSFITIREGSSARPMRTALGAQSVEMRSITLLGMGGEAARIVGGLSLIGGVVLALPFFESAARWRSRGRARGV